MSTPHLDAEPGDFAEAVLMPGDPLRARAIAERFLEQPREVNRRRNMLGYTGTWANQRISVLGGGMGIPSTLIYAQELVQHYGVRRLVRIGTCGSVDARLALGSVVLAQAASTDSRVNRHRFGGHDFAAVASFSLLRAFDRVAQQRQLPMHIGNIFSTDLFYDGDPELVARLQAFGILALEMESAGLYGLAARLRAEAMSILVVSDDLLRGTHMPSSEREQGLDTAITLALDALTSPQGD